MSKIARLIGYRTIPEAIDYISAKINEEIKESDIYQLALRKEITLSISFEHQPQFGKRCPNIAISDKGLRRKYSDEELGNAVFTYYDAKGTFGAIFEDSPTTHLPRVYDLPICGSEKDEIVELLNKIILGDKSSEYYGATHEVMHVKSTEGELFGLVKMITTFDDEDKWIPVTHFPEKSFLVVRSEEIDRFIKSTLNTNQDGLFPELLTQKPEDSQNFMADHQSFPKELQIAISTYYEFWHEKPEETNPATAKTIKSFIDKNFREDISNESFKRITSIIKPEKARKGGAPNSDWKEYKGKSQEK